MGVMHEDVKPQNILIRKDTKDIKLLDFGCGDLWKDSAYTTFAGTPDFFPPEWFRRRRYHAGLATVWSVGVTPYNLLCRSLPFKTDKEIIRAKLRFTRHLSTECRSLISWCLKRKADRRPTLEDLELHPWMQ